MSAFYCVQLPRTSAFFCIRYLVKTWMGCVKSKSFATSVFLDVGGV